MAVTTGTTWDLVLNDTTHAPVRAATVSPRAAYQAALYGRAVVVDLRSKASRERDGRLPAAIATAVVDRRELAPWLSESLATRVLLLDDDGEPVWRAGEGDARVTAIDGGFRAWVSDGLPLG